MFLNKLLKISNNNIKFDFYGFGNKQPVWGDDFMKVISMMESFASVEFDINDIVRSGLVKSYLLSKYNLGF